MGAEQGSKHGSVDSARTKEWTPPTLIDAIGQYALGLGHFSKDANAVVYLKGVPTAAYLGQIGPDNNALSLIVLEQVRLSIDGRRKSVNWRYTSYEGPSLKETLAVGSKEEQKRATRLVAHRPRVIGKARLRERIISDIRRFRRQ